MSFVTYTQLKNLGQAYGLKTKDDIEMFDDLWEVFQVGHDFSKKNEAELHAAVCEAYKDLTDIVAGRPSSGQHGLRRIGTSEANKLVIFSDHHMTPSNHRHDYFRRFNLKTYLALLQRYGDAGYTLVENGDVEELVIFEPTKAEAEKRRKLVRRPLGLLTDVGTLDWEELVGVRVEQRQRQLQSLLNDNAAYYDRVKKSFGRDRYIKISGNHDAYASGVLEGIIESAFWKGVVKDILLVRRPDGSSQRNAFAITHGHQFDHVCVPPFAKQAGETISECISWAFQGPDRIWNVGDTRKWNSAPNKTFLNTLARLHATTTQHPQIENILEFFMTKDVAWEYFENSDPYLAYVREVCTGDEFFKYRHMDENALYSAILGWNALPHFPTLVCGHTHEPRDRAKFDNALARPFQFSNQPVPPNLRSPDTNDCHLATRYMNSGSAGRFENVLWCIEITGDVATVCSWSNSGTPDNIVLKKVRWQSDDRGQLIGTDTAAKV